MPEATAARTSAEVAKPGIRCKCTKLYQSTGSKRAVTDVMSGLLCYVTTKDLMRNSLAYGLQMT